MKRQMSLLLLTILIVTVIPNHAYAFFIPGNPPADDRKFNNYGPMTQNLNVTPYASQQAEYDAYKAGAIDFMDWPLDASQVQELNTIDPSMNTYARAFYADLGMREFDLNDMKFPTDDVWFRKAISMCFDKDSFINNTLGGLALRMDSPLACNPGWYNPNCTNLYPYDRDAAKAMLDAHGYTDQNSDGWREGPTGQTIVLEMYTRKDDPDRTAMGNIFNATLMSIGINVNNHLENRTTCKAICMAAPFNYNIYTGGWSFGGADPDILSFLYAHDPQAYDYCANYPGYNNSDFSGHADAMLAAASVGNSTSDAKGHVYEMQRIMMDDAAIIPVFTYAYYGAYATGWQKVCNADGTGPWSWYTMLDTYNPGRDTIRWSMMGDINTLNVIEPNETSQWNLMNLIYDSLLHVDPYDMSHDQPWMAQNWTTGTWTYNNSTCTTIEFKLREDMYWHDIPANVNRTTPNGNPLLVNGSTDVKVTADDVVFSLMAVKSSTTAWNYNYVADMVYANKTDQHTVKVYMDLLEPLWALHWIGRVPIIPMHVWGPVYDEGTIPNFDALSQECIAGSGPWIFDYDASSLHNYYVLRANARHFSYNACPCWISVDPSTVSVNLDHTFDVAINVSGVTDLYLWVFSVNWNPAVLEFEGITEGGFLSGGGSTIFLQYKRMNQTGGYLEEAACSLCGGNVSGVDGNGTLTILTFKALALGLSPLKIYFHDLYNSKGDSISSESINGMVNVSRDLCITEVSIPYPQLPKYVNVTINMTVTIHNVGTSDVGACNVSFTAYYGGAQVEYFEEKRVIPLVVNNSTTRDFSFTPRQVGNYTLTFKVDCDNEIIESDETNNELSVLIMTRTQGDISGTDGLVNYKDLFTFAQAYPRSTPSDSNWNPAADINYDGIVDEHDLFLLARSYSS